MERDVLLISDQPEEMGGIMRTLKEVAGDQHVRVMLDLEQALQTVQGEQIENVFCSLGGGATDYLDEVWKRNPRGARFLIDSTPDPNTLVRCVLGAHHFIETPVSAEKIQAAMNRAEAAQRFVRNDQIRNLVSRMRTLPARPTVYSEVMREVNSPSASSTIVADLVAKDLSVATKLIQLANSPFFASTQPISDLKEAVLFLGMETVGAVVMSIEAFAKFDKVKPLYFSADKIWKHSQQVADVAKRIAQALGCNREFKSQAYLASLLHDIGKLALAENFPEEYAGITKTSEEEQRPLYLVEQDVFRASHADAGAYLLALWGLPIPIVEGVANHHTAPGALGSSLNPSILVNLAEHLVGSKESIEETVLRFAPELGLRQALPQIRECLPESLARLKNPPSTSIPPADNGEPSPTITAGLPKVTTKGRLARFLGGLRGRTV